MAPKIPIVVRSGPVQTVRPSQQSNTSVTQETTKVVVKGGTQGISADPVWTIKPDATLSYDAQEVLIRVDYSDGTYKDLAYSAGKLITVSGPNLGGQTVTKTLTYTGELLTSVATVVS